MEQIYSLLLGGISVAFVLDQWAGVCAQRGGMGSGVCGASAAIEESGSHILPYPVCVRRVPSHKIASPTHPCLFRPQATTSPS